ncbi:hypothetical protein IWQ62_004485 [Dispira parvispora]|uniref:Hypervirulence associated protein TUDOR domain-containing protein n=1 Tax=Dispira parvispora TaxID=1520584 RepID=A0A9W8AKR3_9FUNG|nr:hypothetical protein IWQ62_004485 [Dispira parvispora]
MPREYCVGDHVRYRPVEGIYTQSTGVIKEVIVDRQPAGDTGVEVKASERHPRYVIQNDNTLKETAYKGEAIDKVVTPIEEER